MEHNNYFFYIVVAASVVGSIVKALKKKPDENQAEPKSSVGGDILKKLLQEIQEKDDYIPRNPVPVPAPAAKPVVKQPAVYPSAKKAQVAFNHSKNAERGYDVPEAKERHTIATSASKSEIFAPVEEYVDPFMASIDLSSPDEMKKAIIYSEIFRTKF